MPTKLSKKKLAERHAERNKPRGNAAKRNSTTWQPGQSGNPNGGASWIAHRIKTSTELDVKNLARRFTRQSIATAAVIMHNTRNPPMVRLAAADLILRRGWGNPANVHQNPDGTALDFGAMSEEQLIEALGKISGVLDNAKVVVPTLIEHRDTTEGDDD